MDWFRFHPGRGLAIVRAKLTGPAGRVIVRLALDTGATHSLVNVGALVALGYDPALAKERTEVTTGSGVEFAPLIAVQRVQALGRQRSGFPMLAHTLPPSATVDGLLGLDFFRNRRLVLDFRRGVLEVT